MPRGQHSFLTYLTKSLFVLLILLVSVLLTWVYFSTDKAIEEQRRLSIELNNRNSSKAMDYNLHTLFDSLSNTATLLARHPIPNLDQKHETLSGIIQADVSSTLDMVRFIGVDQQQIAQVDSPFYELSNTNLHLVKQSEYYLDGGHLLSVSTPRELLWLLVVGKRVTHQASGKMLGTLIGGLVINNNTPLARDLALLSDADYAALQIDNQVICSSKPIPTTLLATAEKMHGTRAKTSIQVAGKKQNFLINRHVYQLANNNSLHILHFYKDTLKGQTLNTFLFSGVLLFLATTILFSLFFLLFQQQIVKAITHLLQYTKQASSPGQKLVYTPGPFLEFNYIGEAVEQMVAQLDSSRNKLLNEQALLISLRNSIPDIIFYKDKNSVYLGCNSAFEEYTGQLEEKLIGKTDQAFFDKETAESYKEQDRQMLALGNTRRNEEWIEYPDGRRVLLDTVKTPYFGPDGSILGLIGISRDITERKRTEEQIIRLNHLREELLGLGSLKEKLTHVTEAVIKVLNADFCRIWIIKPGDRCNSGCPHAGDTEALDSCQSSERCLHLMASSGRYTGLDSAIHGRVPFGSYKIGMIASGKIDSFNTNDVTHDPRVHDHEWAKRLGLVSFAGYRLFSEKGTTIGVLALFSKHVIGPQEVGLLEGVANSTSQVIQMTMAEAEKETMQANLLRAQKMEAIGLMAGGVAHDLNNILAGIVGYPELMLLDLPQSSELRKPIEAIRESGKRATIIVDDLLTVARGAASTREPHDINVLIQEYLDSPECEKLNSLHPKVIFTQQLNAENAIISCSPVHIKKTLMNLITNAVEAIDDKGNVLIKTDNLEVDGSDILEHDIEPGSYLSLTVRDDGPGIGSKDLEHIFEPFYTKKIMGHSGTGLGLAIVWNTIQDHNGRIFVESSDKGTTFQLYFPASTTKAAVHSTKNTTEEFTSKNEHILVVDDEPQMRDIASQMLRAMGYSVDSVSSGELALAFIQETPVDLIMIDMLMDPGMNGRQTYEEIITLYPDQKGIIASGFSESDDVKATLELGAGGFIKKPYSMAQLGRMVREVLHG